MIETPVLSSISDQLADLVLAILDWCTSTKPCRTMSEPLLSAMYRAYTALKCDDETQCETIYNELCAVMEQRKVNEKGN